MDNIKDYLMKLMSVRNNIQLSTIEAIVSHQYEEANKALMTNDTIELSGFGKFTFNRKKAQRKLDKELSKKQVFEGIINNPLSSDQKKQSAQNKLNSTLRDIDLLSKRLLHEQA